MTNEARSAGGKLRPVRARLSWLGVVVLVAAACAPAATPVPSPAPTPTSAPPTSTRAPSPTPLPAGQVALTDVGLEDALLLEGPWRAQPVELFDPAMAQPGFDDSAWPEVTAPAGWAEQGFGTLTGQAAVVVYRRTVTAPPAWQGQPIGISAWFNPHVSQVFVNGTRLEPTGAPFAPYADVSDLLNYGGENTLLVTAVYDGHYQAAGAGPARLGPLVTRPATEVAQEELIFATPGGEASATLIWPAARENLPAIVLVATGSHGLAEKQTWYEFASDLARQGYASLALALPVQDAAGMAAALEVLRARPEVALNRIVLFGAGEAAEVVVEAAAADEQVKGLVLLSTPTIEAVATLGDRPVLLLAAEGDRRGRVLEEMTAMEGLASGPVIVAALPGDGHGTFVFTNAWNATRGAVLDWLQAYLPPAAP